MTPILAIARGELLMLARNKTVAVSAIVVPLAAGIYIAYAAGDDASGAGGIAALQVLILLTMSVYATATTTLERVAGTCFSSGCAAAPSVMPPSSSACCCQSWPSRSGRSRSCSGSLSRRQENFPTTSDCWSSASSPAP